MVINAKKLNDLGITVRVYDNGVDGESRAMKLRDATVEIFVEHGSIPQALTDFLHDAIQSPEYREALLPAIVHKIHMFQILEAIDRTQD